MMSAPKRVLLDTDIVIHLLKKRSDIVECFIRLHEKGVEFYLSPIVVAEIYAGALKKEHQEVEAFFNLCTRLTLNANTAKQAGLFAARYRKAYQGISLEDYVLAATAEQLACPLWTLNKKHYPMSEIVLFEDWREDNADDSENKDFVKNNFPL